MQKILLVIIFMPTAIYTAYKPGRVPLQVQVNGTALTVYLTPEDIIKLRRHTTARLNNINKTTTQ